MSEKDLSKGWTVTFSGMGVNLALGILYAWSVFSKQLVEPAARDRLDELQATLRSEEHTSELQSP